MSAVKLKIVNKMMIYVTEFWKITHTIMPETIGIFDYHSAADSTKSFSSIFKNFLVILGHFELFNT